MKRWCWCRAIKLSKKQVMRETIEPGMVVVHSRKWCKVRETK